MTTSDTVRVTRACVLLCIPDLLLGLLSHVGLWNQTWMHFSQG